MTAKVNSLPILLTNKPARMFYKTEEPTAVKYLRRKVADDEAQQEIEDFMFHIDDDETHAPTNEILRNPS